MKISTPTNCRRRFPLGLELRYKTFSEGVISSGVGRTLMIGGDVVFTGDVAIEPGARVELSIDWPARLDDRINLQLKIDGFVLHTSGDLMVASVGDYRILTRGSARFGPGPAPVFFAPLAAGAGASATA